MDFDKVGKNTGFFSFTKTIADLAANKKFTEGYRTLISDNDKLDEKTFIWHSLSAISEIVGTTIYENVLNYIDNVSNIDTCKVKALASISKVLGITNNGILETIDKMPPEVLKFLDIFSINKSYLTDPTMLRSDLFFEIMKKVNSDISYRKMIEEARKNAINSLSGIPSSSIVIKSNFPENLYKEFVFNAFYDLLSSRIYATYDGKTDNHYYFPTSSDIENDSIQNSYSIYKNLIVRYKSQQNENIPPYCFYDAIDLDFDWRESIESLKNVYGLNSFDPFKVADNIYDGEDSIENYSGAKLMILQQVFNNRNAQKFANNPLTKYAYYSEKQVVDYLHYVNSQYLFGKTKSYNLLSSSNIYDVNQNYMVLNIYDTSANWVKDTIINPSSGVLKIRDEVISSVAEILQDMCFSIVDIREKLKTQAQRNYMRGTFLLISYVVSEYLKKNLPMQYPELLRYLSSYYYNKGSSNGWEVDIVEYIDTTEYYNLSTDTSKYALYGNTVNMPFWKDTDNGIAGVGIALKDIERFYLSTLNIKTVANSTFDFLNVIYELGADRGYIDKRTSSDIIVGAVQDNLQEDVDRGYMSQKDFNEISSYQKNIFLSYNGTKFGFDPYYNWKNMAHPSYQIHPYLPRFIEYTHIPYAIKNVFIHDANAELMIAMRTPELSTILGECGQILNIWDRNALTFHGWKTRYENNTHDQVTNYGKISPLQHYDGVFYPSAIEEYIEATKDDVKFEELLYSVEKLSSCQNIKNYFYNELDYNHDFNRNPLVVNGLSLYTDIFDFAKEIVCSEISLKMELSNDEADNKFINYLSSHIKEMKNSDVLKKTYYEKWYSHLDLQPPDCYKIANQLREFKPDIIDLHMSRPVSAETYDIYKYGLDKYSNSYILYKKCHLNDSYTTKRNKRGELWFRFNSHPIGFPLFVGSPYMANTDYLSNVGQINTENTFRDFAHILSSWPERRLSDCIFDFDFTDDYRSIIIAYDTTRSINDYSRISSFLIAKPYESPAKYDDYGNRLLDFQLAVYTNNLTHYYREDFLSSYEFQGLYQDDIYVQGIWSKVDTIPTGDMPNNVIDIARIRFPDENNAVKSIFSTYLVERNVFPYYCLNFSTKLIDPKIRIGFANDLYTIAAVTQVESNNIASMTYIGANTVITSSDTNLDSIRNDTYGRNIEYFLSADDIPGEYNSIDRFNHYLTLASFTTNHFEGNAGQAPGIDDFRITAKNYNLNPDASYIPLYSGLLGFSRVWAANFYKTKQLQSIELLGYSFNELDDKIKDFSTTIVTDDDGISSNTDITSLLNGVFRVYEQYDNGREFFIAEYNDIIRKDPNTNRFPAWEISLSSLVGLSANSDYKIQMFNVYKGAQCPILMCDLSAASENIRYLSSGTVADNYYLSHDYMLPNMIEVVGTPNIFEFAYDPNFASGKSNYILNISSLNINAYYEENSKKLKIDFNIQIPEKNYIIDRGNLLVIVYKPNLHWMENYHFLVPHDIWPNLSVNNSILNDETRKYKIEENDYIQTVLSDYTSFKNSVVYNQETGISNYTIVSTILSDYTYVNNPIEAISKIPVLSTGTYTFKISEQDTIKIRFPNGNVADEIEKIFNTVSIQTNDLSNIFALHNTYIFELDRPKYFADLIGRVRLGVYADNDECARVYEDYISSMYSVSKFKAEILHYMHFYEDEISDVIKPYDNDKPYEQLYDESCFYLSAVNPEFDPLSTELSTVLLSSAEWHDKIDWMSIKIDNMGDVDDIDYVVDHIVTEEDIKDFLKLYVNYRTYIAGDHEEIELFFNYNNYFCTPFSYRNSAGDFVPTYKDGTFLRLKSGETGFLNVIIQVKYFNHLGSVCAVKDVPLMSYKIRNVSDDKPKFVILRTWTLTPELVLASKGPALSTENSATLRIEEKAYGPTFQFNGKPLSSYMNEDFTINEDFVVDCDYQIIANDFGSGKYTIIYEYSNPYISPNFTKIGRDNPAANIQIAKNKSIQVNTSKIDFKFSLTVKKGSVIDEDEGSLYIPLDAQNFKAKNLEGEDIVDLQIIPGGITLYFGSESMVSQYRFLGKEKPSGEFNGFILGENGKVIRMYQNKAF